MEGKGFLMLSWHAATFWVYLRRAQSISSRRTLRVSSSMSGASTL